MTRVRQLFSLLFSDIKHGKCLIVKSKFGYSLKFLEEFVFMKYKFATQNYNNI